MTKPDIDILSVDDSNVQDVGFFCYKSKRNSTGYAKKLSWLRQRLSEGMRLRILLENGVSKGFIEYIPGEYAWRAVKARRYMFIHCMWVVGKAKGKGYGALLLQHCLRDAKRENMHGVAVLASTGNWLANPVFFLKAGFEVADRSSPSFTLLASTFGKRAPPSLPTDWGSRRKALGPGLTVVLTDQCPYIDRMKQAVFNVSEQLGISAREIRLTTARQVQDRAPSPYGVYSVVYRGDVISCRPIGTEPLLKLIRQGT